MNRNKPNQPPEIAVKDQMEVVLKEYEALRKEIDDRVNAPKLYFAPLLFVLLAGLLGWKAEAPFDLVLLFIFPTFLTFLSFAANAGYYLQRAGVQIADIENKVFLISGLPLLSHETELIIRRKGLRQWLLLLFGSLVGASYILIEALLFFSLRIENLSQLAANSGRRYLVLMFLALPFVLFSSSAVRLLLFWRSYRSYDSKLLRELR